MVSQLTSRIIGVMESHAQELCGSYYTRNGSKPPSHCLLGWMAVEAEIELPPQRYNSHVIGMPGTKRFAEALQHAYGLTLGELKQLQLANDEAMSSMETIKMVSDLIYEWGNTAEIAA